MGEAKRKAVVEMNQAYFQVRLNLILAFLKERPGEAIDVQEIERLSRYVVDGPAIQPVHGTLISA